MSFFTHDRMCDDILTVKAAQVINQGANCLKFMVPHMIYIDDRDI